MTKENNTIRARKIALRVEGYLELGMPEHALSEIQKASQEHLLFNPHMLYLEGEALWQLKRYRDALYPLGQAALLEPAEVRVWILIGKCQKRIGRCDLAIESLENALYLQPNSPLILYNLSIYLALSERKEESVRILARAICLDPKYRQHARTEKDFEGIRNMQEFKNLMNEEELLSENQEK
ncbi:MAG: hypothetical protein Q4C96_02265 [Planctomycetia bacterium]|nr:hypothetical protein [Planctomycetia bacterium]